MLDSLIETKQLTVKAGHRLLLDGIDWAVRPGEQWVVFGSNGSGKTTLLSAVAGFRRYSSGAISLFGEPLGASNILENRKRIGWVSSSFFDNYYRSESSMEIVLSSKTGSLGLDFSIDEHDIGNALSWLARFGIADKRDMPFSSLSKGQRQSVLLARALFSNPDILVLDEPCSGLDVDARERVLDMVEDLVKTQGKTVIYVTHYPEEILDVFTHALLLKGGRTYASGLIADCFTSEIMSGLMGHRSLIERDAADRMRIVFERVGER